MPIAQARKARMTLADLNPAHYNPKVALSPDMPEYQDIKRSLLTFGQVEPLVWNERTGRLVGGHQRRQVMLDLGETEADVNIVDLDETQEQALNLALNKIKGRWDEAKLADLLGSLNATRADALALTGFRADELTASLQRYQRMHAGDFLSDILQSSGAGAASTVAGIFGGAAGGADDDADEYADEYADEEDSEEDAGYGAERGGSAPSQSQGTTDPSALPDATPALAGAPSEPEVYFALTYSVTGPQREIVQDALKQVRAIYHLPTSIEALVWLATDFLARQSAAGQS